MTPTLLIIICLITAAILMVAEVLLPSHGVLGVLALLAYVTAIGACFYINRYIGLGVLIASLVAAPFAAAGLIGLWQKSPVGRRMVLHPTSEHVAPPLVPIGAQGICISELKPMGECEFGEQRIEVMSELNMIAPGSRVHVVAFANGKPVVRVSA